MAFTQRLYEYLKAGYGFLGVETCEDVRVIGDVSYVAQSCPRDGSRWESLGVLHENPVRVVVWDAVRGFTAAPPIPGDAQSADRVHELVQALGTTASRIKDPLEALQAVVGADRPVTGNGVIFIFLNIDDYVKSSQVYQQIRNMANSGQVSGALQRRVLFLSPNLRLLHDKVSGCVTKVPFELPDDDQIRAAIQGVSDAITTAESTTAQLTCPPDLEQSLVQACRGLTQSEISDVLSLCTVRHGEFTPLMLPTVRAEKAEIVRRSEVLQYIPEQSIATREQIGGFGAYLDWLDTRRQACSREAEVADMPAPRGVVLVGPPGTAKSMVAKATCQLLGLPGYVLDVGSLFSSLVGSSEARLRDVLRIVDAQQGSVLVIDEADKALGGAHQADGDSGVTRRLFGMLLTWLAEQKSRTFTIMTLNRTEGLPPELLRAGRFDAVFYTDLPNAEERRTILEIHLKKLGAVSSFAEAEWQQFVAESENFAGAEIEEAVRSSVFAAWAARRAKPPTAVELLQEIKRVVPMSRSDGAAITAMRALCQDRYRSVNYSQPTTIQPQPTKSSRRPRVIDVSNN